MAATTSCATQISTPSKTLPLVKASSSASSNLAFLPSSYKLNLKSLRVRRYAGGGGSGGGALGARMVSVPAMKPPASLDFQTNIFKKDKVNLAGHDEVCSLLSLIVWDSSWFLDSFVGVINVYVGICFASSDFEMGFCG